PKEAKTSKQRTLTKQCRSAILSHCTIRTMPFELPCGQRCADELLAVVHVQTAIRVGWVAPGHNPAPGFFQWLKQLGPADLMVAVRPEFRDNQFALVVPKKCPVL